MFEVKVLADSVSRGSRLTTLQLTYPRAVHCFHEQTEFLSQINNEMPEFRCYDAIVALGAKVGQFMPETNEVEFVQPEAWIKRPHAGKMVSHSRKTFEMCVTAEHRMFSLRRTTGNQFLPHVDTASEWVGDYTAHRRIPQAASLLKSQRVYRNEDEAVLIAFYVADGHRPSANTMNFHFRKQRKINAVVNVLTRLGIEHEVKRYGSDCVIKFDALNWVDECYTDDGEKKYPDRLYAMTEDVWAAFKQATLESDGSVRNREVNTCSVKCAEQLQVFAFLNNEAMNIRSYQQNGHREIYKQKYQDTPFVSFRADTNPFCETEYDGNVVCFSVPSSFLCVRYNGFAFVSGNCEFMTHRTHSRNAASSRAIPVRKMLRDVWRNPFVPIHWGRNQSGMQARSELTGWQRLVCRELWLKTRLVAMAAVWLMVQCGLHKQIANRILEPWMWITVIASSEERGWKNFFHLRCSEFAEPHIRRVAEMCRDAMDQSEAKYLKPGEWHLPLVGFEGDDELSPADRIGVSVGRCARVSYLTHNGQRDPQKDLELHDKLMNDGHWSPFEHQATPSFEGEKGHGGNFGDEWWQYRKQFPREMVR